MSGDEHRFVSLKAGDGDTLEGVEGEGIGFRRGAIEERGGERTVDGFVLAGEVASGNGDFVDAGPRQGRGALLRRLWWLLVGDVGGCGFLLALLAFPER